MTSSDLPADLDLRGRTALVTGCGSETGIGFATARALAERGARVIMTATSDRIERRADELRAGGHDAHGVVGRLETEGAAHAVLDAARKTGGSLDILVNNAGMVSIGERLPGHARGDRRDARAKVGPRDHGRVHHGSGPGRA
jgi:3-oxoacyl-[acyl-carrier protein] reductase